MMVDSHAHLDDPRYDHDRDEVIERAWDNHVRCILTVQCDLHPERIHRTLEMLDTHPFIWAAFGLHPHEARHWTPETAESLRAYWAHDRVVAIGETGLDYHYMYSPKETQIRVFEWHIEQANALRMPLVVHTRSAHDDTLAILRSVCEWTAPVIIHCFTGDDRVARQYLDLGCYLSFSGIVTFANADDIRAAARTTPSDRLLVETDSPYLTPVPYRGRRNEPAYVLKVIEFIARLRETRIGVLKDAVLENFLRAYPGVRLSERAPGPALESAPGVDHGK